MAPCSKVQRQTAVAAYLKSTAVTAVCPRTADWPPVQRSGLRNAHMCEDNPCSAESGNSRGLYVPRVKVQSKTLYFRIVRISKSDLPEELSY